MSFWTLDRVASALAGLLRGAAPAGSRALHGVATDTRTIADGDLFVALRGERYDAHDFLDDAVARGAVALVVSDVRRAAKAGVPVFEVEDTTAALGALGRFRRRAWSKPVVAVAGSNGKTSTKEMLTAALATCFEVHATRGNLNNHVGVPLTLLAIPDTAEIAVVEIGTNHPGEVATLRALVEPDVAIVTSIGEEHLEGLGDLAGVLREESAVFAGVPLAITPAAQPEVASAARTLAGNTVEAGLDAGDVRPVRWGIDGDGAGWLDFGDVTVRPSLRGAHNLRNAMLAIAAARACGVSLEDSARGIAATPALSMRTSWQSIGHLTVINDAYNANPASARAAVALLDGLDTARQRVIILGSMLELGESGPALHDEIARRALASRADLVAGIGEFARALRATANGDHRVVIADDVDALWAALAPRVKADAVVLLKASRGIKLERMLPKLTEFASALTR